jgi:N-acyl-D-glutamate deacylase
LRLGEVIACSSALARGVFENTNQLTVGVQSVVVNGGVVVSDGELVLDAPFGRPIRNAQID